MTYDGENNIPEKNSVSENIPDEAAASNDPSLESILAEIKGEAFIDGDKRTPPDILQEKTDRIIHQETGKDPDLAFEQALMGSKVTKDLNARPLFDKAPEEMDDADRWFAEFLSGKNPAPYSPEKSGAGEEPAAAPAQPAPENDAASVPAVPVDTETEETVSSAVQDVPIGRVEDYTSIDYTDPRSMDEFAEEVSRNLEREAIVEEPYQPASHRVRRQSKRPARIYREDNASSAPDPLAESSRFSGPLSHLTIRLTAAGVLCFIMTLFSYLFSAGRSLPFGIGTDQTALAGVLLILQMLVMMLAMDILVSGVTDIVRAEPGAESLLVISCLVTIVDGFILFAKQETELGLPFSLVSAWAVFFALWGRKSYYAAMRDSLRMAAAGAKPYGVISENSLEDHVILKKLAGETDGFYINLMQADSGETTYMLAAPILLILALVFAFLASVGHGRPETFTHCFAIMLAVAAAFPATSVFAIPFRYVAKRAKQAGSALAGWGGACSVFDSDSAIITDEDIFPVGTVSLSGVKLLGNVSQSKAITYTSSLIIASKSGLSKVFAALMKDQKLPVMEIEDFACYEGGGIGALLDDERVLVGSGAFMNLMGIRVPESINLNNSVFTAINDELAAVFSINYVPANSVQNALISLLNTQVDILLAVRDFNVSPAMIQHKFKVSMEGVRIIPAEASYQVSDDRVAEGTLCSAILCREGLGPFAEVITSGRSLKRITDINTIISIAGSVMGLILMFFLCWSGAFISASVKNVFIFMLVLEVCVVLLSNVVRQRA